MGGAKFFISSRVENSFLPRSLRVQSLYLTPTEPQPLTETEENDLQLAARRLSAICQRCGQANTPPTNRRRILLRSTCHRLPHLLGSIKVQSWRSAYCLRDNSDLFEGLKREDDERCGRCSSRRGHSGGEARARHLPEQRDPAGSGHGHTVSTARELPRNASVLQRLRFFHDGASQQRSCWRLFSPPTTFNPMIN